MTADAREIEARYKAIHSLVDTMGKDLLKLMRHPDSTPEQIITGKDRYFNAYRMWIETRTLLREKYPHRNHPLQRTLPWNKEDTL